LEAQKAVPELKPLFEQTGQVAMASAEDAKQAAADSKQATEVEGKQAVGGQKTPPPPGLLFDKKILPLVPFAIRGVIWYQGEANSYTVHAILYGIQLATMIRDWRSRWGYDFSFITVQLPDIGSAQTEPVQTHGRVLVREGVLKSLAWLSRSEPARRSRIIRGTNRKRGGAWRNGPSRQSISRKA
jgi:sialate O-acetylesterase